MLALSSFVSSSVSTLSALVYLSVRIEKLPPTSLTRPCLQLARLVWTKHSPRCQGLLLLFLSLGLYLKVLVIHDPTKSSFEKGGSWTEQFLHQSLQAKQVPESIILRHAGISWKLSELCQVERTSIHSETRWNGAHGLQKEHAYVKRMYKMHQIS